MCWWLQLDNTAGSRPRCVSWMHGERQAVSERLTRLVNYPGVVVAPESQWMPRGIPIQNPDGIWDVSPAEEAKLDQPNDLIAECESQQLANWWLEHAGNANTPNLDIASTCMVYGRNGILIVEAKAHVGELMGEEKGKQLKNNASDRSFDNHLKIGRAIADAAARFQRSTGQPCAISRDMCYQMSNRFALASKLTEMGYAVVLVYLGFLNAHEMQDGRTLLTSERQWAEAVAKHSEVLFPNGLWNKAWKLNGHAFIPLIRSLEWPIAP